MWIHCYIYKCKHKWNIVFNYLIRTQEVTKCNFFLSFPPLISHITYLKLFKSTYIWPNSYSSLTWMHMRSNSIPLHDFIRNREGKYSNPWTNRVKPNVNGRTHKDVNYLFFLLWPIIYFFHKLVEVVNAFRWEEYGSQIRMGKAIIF